MFNSAKRGIRKLVARTLLFFIGLSLTSVAYAATVTWSGAGGTSWATGSSWSIAAGPGSGDTAAFTDAGATTIPGDVTSVLNTSRTIGGLTFSNTATKFQTLDLNGKTLTLNGSVSFNLDQSALSTTTVRNGTLTMNSAFATLNVGRAASGSSKSIVDLSGLTALTGTLQDLHVGSSTANGATGTLSLPALTNLTLQHIYVGTANAGGDVSGTLHLGLSSTLNAIELDVGKNNGGGTVDIAGGGTLNLGTAASHALLQVGVETLDSNNDYTAKFDMSAGVLNAYLTSVIVGQKQGGGFGDAIGVWNGGSAGAITIGTTGNSANFYVGRKLTGNSDGGANGTVDLSAANTLSADLNEFVIGNAINGSASGSVKLAKTSSINALSIVVGLNGGGTLTLGKTSNTILANSLTIGQSLGNGSVLVAPGATVSIGSAAQRTSLSIGSGIANTNDAFGGKLDLTGTTLTAFFSDVTVGEKEGGGFGSNLGTFNAGSAGSIDIGAAGNTANFHVGRKLEGGSDAGAVGTVDFSGAGTLTASLNEFTIGTSVDGSASGTVKLAKSNTIDALSIVVGLGGGGTSTLTLGKTANSIVADSITVGQASASGNILVAPGATVGLGSAARRASISVGTGLANTNSDYNGRIDFTGATLTAFLGDLTVGEKEGGGFGKNYGTFIAGGAGTIDIGAPGNTANLYVGRKLTGGTDSGAVGNVDFGGLSSLTASLNSLTVGTSLSGSASGTLILAQSNNINAKSIVIGSSGDGTDTLALGKTNTILTNQFVIAQDYASAAVTIPGGGTLNLGSAAQRTTLLIGTGVTNTNNVYSGSLDLTNATFNAYLANVTIGNKDNNPGTELGTLTIGTSPANYVEAADVLLGGTHSTGTLNFGGGIFIANSIAKGAGTGNFNWTGGRLSVGTFGTNTTSFNLANSGTGTLAPGSAAQSLGTTTIYGNYTQGVAAATELEISATGNDLVTVSGSATLNGTLTLKSLNNFTPTVGQSFLLENYASHSGTFSFVAPPKLAADTAFQLDYSNPTQLMLRIVSPNSANYVAPAPTGTWATAASWDTQAVPSTITATNVVNSGASPKIVTVGASTTVHRVNLQGASAAAPLSLEILQGVRFGVSNQLVIGANATLTGGGTVLGDVIAAGGASIAPGPVPASPAAASPGILQVGGNLTTQTASNLAVEIGGTTAGTNFDQLVVGGNASFSGNLAVKLINGFSPAPLQQFDIVTYATHSGSLTANGAISAGGNLVFAPIYQADRLTLISTIPGDVTTDGKVSFADLVVIAQNYGSSHATWSTGDLSNDGSVSFADLVTVAQNYGQGLAAAGAVPGASAEFNEAWAAAVNSVPEPGMMGFLGIGSLALLKRRRQH
jgi:hypothetical protein